MPLLSILSNKSIKAKAKVEAISNMLLEEEVSMENLVKAAKAWKDPDKANCIEALEFATKTKPELGTASCLAFVTGTLLEKAPRIRWESAKVIGNIAHLYPTKLDDAVKNLLINSEHPEQWYAGVRHLHWVRSSN